MPNIKTLINPGILEIRTLAEKGRGVFAQVHIPESTLIESSPVVRLTPEESEIISKTILHYYIFEWEEFDSVAGKKYDSAILSGFGQFLNHSDKPNVKLEWDYPTMSMSLKSIKDIKPGDELTHDYDCELWFDPA